METLLIDQIIKELQQRQQDFENPGFGDLNLNLTQLFRPKLAYVECKAKAEAFEEAIQIIKTISKQK